MLSWHSTICPAYLRLQLESRSLIAIFSLCSSCLHAGVSIACATTLRGCGHHTCCSCCFCLCFLGHATHHILLSWSSLFLYPGKTLAHTLAMRSSGLVMYWQLVTPWLTHLHHAPLVLWCTDNFHKALCIADWKLNRLITKSHKTLFQLTLFCIASTQAMTSAIATAVSHCTPALLRHHEVQVSALDHLLNYLCGSRGLCLIMVRYPEQG
jgi:hypothetical protein